MKYKTYLDQIGKVTSEVIISAPDTREGHEDIYDDPAYISLRDEMKDILLEKLAESETPPYTQWLERLPEHVRNKS